MIRPFRLLFGDLYPLPVAGAIAQILIETIARS